MRKVFVIVFTTFFTASIAQFDNLGLNSLWNKGTITLKDKSVFEGFIHNNDKLGLVKFKKTSDSEEMSFKQTSILLLDYFDQESSTRRKFGLFGYYDEDSGKAANVLFEIMKEFAQMGVLKKNSTVNPALRLRRNTITGEVYVEKVGFDQWKGFYLVNEDGKIELVMAINQLESDRENFLATKYRTFLDRDTIQKYIGPKWKQVRQFIKQNNLNLRHEHDFLKAMDYFGQLEGV